MKHPWNPILAELKRLYAREDKLRKKKMIHKRERPISEITIEDLTKETRIRCADYDEEINRSIEAWKFGEEFPVISEDAQIWRYARVNTALSFFMMLFTPVDDHILFPRPQVDDETAIKWLLTTWWTIHGVNFRSLLEKGMEPKAPINFR